MPKNNEAMLAKYFKLPNRRLESYFGIVQSGQPKIYYTGFAKGKTMSEVLHEWKPKVDTLLDKWPTLVDFENDLAKKVGPMSVMKPLSERLTDIDHYYEDISLSSTPIDKSALAAVVSEWSAARGLAIRSQARTMEEMRKSTNSGSPYFDKRRDVVAQTVPAKIFLNGDSVIQELPGGTWEACAVLGWRGQEGGPAASDVKQRVVWMFPFSVNLLELCCYQPLIELAQRFNIVPSWVSMDAVADRMTKLFDTKARDDLIVCTDFSRFDQHMNPNMQSGAKTIIRSILNRTPESDQWLENIFPIKYVLPLVASPGYLRTGVHGMGSGSGGTNADETLVHRALQYEAARAHHQKLNPNSQCLGDDGVISYPGITVEDVVRSYSSHGQDMNTDKQFSSTDTAHYLRRWYNKDYRVNGVCQGVYSTYRALGRLRYTERRMDPKLWGPAEISLRAISIIENTKYHPLFEQFVEFCIQRDKYGVGIKVPGFLEHISDIAEEAMRKIPDLLGFTKTMQSDELGIADWAVVKYLRSRAKSQIVQ